MSNNQNNTKYLLGMIIAMLIWGVAWTSGKVVVDHANAEIAAFWRYAISFITIIPILWYFKTSLKADFIAYIYMVLAGILVALFNYLFFKGLSHGNAGYGGTLVTAISAIITYLMTIALFKNKVSSKQIIALSIGILGAIILLKIPFEGLGFLNMDSLYFLECAFIWSVVTILAQKASKRVDPMLYSLVVFGITAIINMYFALPYHPFDILSFDSVFWWNITFIGVLAGSFSTSLYFVSASHLGASNTGVFLFIVPMGAIVSSFIVYGENILLSTLIGCLLTFIAVILFNSKRKKIKI